jgi:dienelactone hydrolase
VLLMPTVVVAEPGDVTVERLRRAADGAGIDVTTATGDKAREVLADAAAGAAGLAVVGVGTQAGAALDAASERGDIDAFVSLAGVLDAAHRDLIAAWPELPVLAVAPPGDRVALAAAVDAYLASPHPHSDLVARGESVDESVDAVVAWLRDRAAERVDVGAVTCTSSDGWEIHGTLRVPHREAPVPGVVLLHTGRSDRAAYARLERLLPAAGLAVLNVDWRGRGESINLGSYFDLDADTKAAGWRDALAALALLAADARVDGERLAAVGCVHGAEYAVRAAWRDRRVRALVILTGYRPSEPEEEALLVSGDVDVLYVNATGHTITGDAMRDLCSRAPRRSAQLIEYPGSALGYQRFEVDPTLETRIASWLSEVLA